MKSVAPLKFPWQKWPVIREEASLRKYKYARYFSSALLRSRAKAPNKYSSADELDDFDAQHYQFDYSLGRYASRYMPKFVVASLDELAIEENCFFAPEANIVPAGFDNRAFFSGLALFPVIRKNNCSIYLIDGHRWAYWGWREAMARGEIVNKGLNIFHIDKHDDIAEGAIKGEVLKVLSLPEMENLHILMAEKSGAGQGFIKFDRFLGYCLNVLLKKPTVELTIEEAGWVKFYESFVKGELNFQANPLDVTRLLYLCGGMIGDNSYLRFAERTMQVDNVWQISKTAYWSEAYLNNVLEEEPLADTSFYERSGHNFVHLGQEDMTMSHKDRKQTVLDIDCDAGSTEEIISFLRLQRARGFKPGVITIALSPGECANYTDVTDAPQRLKLSNFYDLFPHLRDLENAPNFEDRRSQVTINHFDNMVKLAEEFIENW